MRQKAKMLMAKFLIGWQNQTVDEIAITVKKIIGNDVEIIKSKLMIIDPTTYLHKKLKVN